MAAGTTVEEHLTQLDTVIGDRQAVSSSNAALNAAVKQSISAGFQATGNALGDMDFSRTKYISSSTDLSSAMRSFDANLSRIEHNLSSLDDRMRGGFASMAALSALVPNARVDHNTSISVGTGFYRDRVGGALGVFHYVNDNLMLNMGVAYGGSNSLTGRAGATFGW